jgi:uncharacterized membrane protein YeiH
MSIIYVFDLAGTFVFAISGILTATRNRLDWFGGLVIALVTAVGGGTLRDMMIGSTPVGWMQDLNYLIAILAGSLIAYFFRGTVRRLRRTMFLFDSIGIGLFTILGLTKTLDAGLSIPVAILMGVVSAVFGGVVRDTLCNAVPLIFRKEIYATACLAGGTLYVSLIYFGVVENVAIVSTVVFIILLRILAVRFHWSLPALDGSRTTADGK